MALTAPSLTAIRAHTGSTYYQRGVAYYASGKVVDARLANGVLTGSVKGSRTKSYGVSIELDGRTIVSSTCTCPINWRCKHVAAILVAMHHSSTDLKVQEKPAPPKVSVPLGLSSAQLTKWAEQHHVADAISSQLQTNLDWHRDWRLTRDFRTVAALLLHPPAKPFKKAYRADAIAVVRQVQSDISELSDYRQHVIDYVTDAEIWRAEAPPEPELLDMWAWLRARPAPGVPWGSDLTTISEHPDAQVDTAGPWLVMAERRGAYTTKVKLPIQPRGAPDNEPSAQPVGLALDLLTHPRLRNHQLRVDVLAAAMIRPWQRAMAELDQVIERAQPTPEAAADVQELGWKVWFYGNTLHVRPVRVQPYKTRAGLRSASVSLEARWLKLPQDKEAAVHVQASAYGRLQIVSAYKAVRALVAHPRVIDDHGNVLAVRRSQAKLVWEPTVEGGLRVSVVVGGIALADEQLHDLLCRRLDDVALHHSAADARCTVVDMTDQLHTLLSALSSRSQVFPAQARRVMLERFDKLGDVAPMELRGELRGAEVEGDLRPLLRLSIAADGVLDVETFSRPLPEARPWAPGQGPSEISAIRDGERVYVCRDLRAEPDHFNELLSGLGLPELSSFSCGLDDPDDGLDAVQRLQEAGDAVRVEWSNTKPQITRDATADDLRVRGAMSRDWFGLKGGLDVDGVTVPLSALLDAVRGGRRFVVVGQGAWVALTDRLRGQLEATAALARTVKNGVEMPPLAVSVLAEVEEAGAQIKLPKRFRVQMKRLQEAASLEPRVPDSLNAELREYQRLGFQWVSRLAHWAPGAVLADDMGLGKTIQALTVLLCRAEIGPALVVAPASVGVNWAREAARFAPSLQVHTYRGAGRASLLERVGPGDVLVTSWELMTRDVEQLGAVGFATAVLDEAQAIKNANTRRARASSELGAEFVLALTGTPVENRVGELWSLMRTVVPGLLGPAQRFRERFVSPIERDGAEQPRRVLSQLIRPFLLRRVKSEVALDLPARVESIISIDLSPTERKLYDAFRFAAVAELTGKGEGGEGQRFRILAALTRMRQLACSPALVEPDEGHPRSTKISRLVHILRDLKAEGHRALIFSQFTTLLKLARAALEEAGLSVRYLDGSTPIKRRQVEVDEFQAGSGDAFLISLKAGGTGLNLTAATYVFHLDPWWNPAVEDQATDRAHRIGQTQPVNVFRLVATDTIEEQVIAMHQQKRALVADLLQGTGKASAMSTHQLMDVLRGEGAVLDASEVVPADKVAKSKTPADSKKPAKPEAAAKSKAPARPKQATMSNASKLKAAKSTPAPKAGASGAPKSKSATKTRSKSATKTRSKAVAPARPKKPAKPNKSLTESFSAAVQASVDASERSSANARALSRAVGNLQSWARQEGVSLSTAAEVERAAGGYLAALAAGRIKTGRADLTYGKRAYRWLAEIAER